jgi:hypothetical protein
MYFFLLCTSVQKRVSWLIAGEICLSLSLFGRQPSRQSIEPDSIETDSVEIPAVLEESMAVSNIAEEQEPLLSRSTSMDSDSSTDASHLVDVPMSPMSPRLKVCSCCSYMHKALIETGDGTRNTKGALGDVTSK